VTGCRIRYGVSTARLSLRLTSSWPMPSRINASPSRSEMSFPRKSIGEISARVAFVDGPWCEIQMVPKPLRSQRLRLSTVPLTCQNGRFVHCLLDDYITVVCRRSAGWTAARLCHVYQQCGSANSGGTKDCWLMAAGREVVVWNQSWCGAAFLTD
jgi:hypothetical protein